MGEFRDIEEVIYQFGHHFTGIIPIIVRERKSLKMVEKVSAHISFHPRSHDMAPGSDEILAEIPDDIQSE